MKKGIGILCAAAAAIMLTACGSKQEETVSIEIESLAEELLETVTSDSLSETASSLIPSIYYLDEDAVVSAVAYASSGATSCEIAVIESADTEDAAAAEEKLQTRVDNQTELYATYNESEADRLDTAIIKSTGVYTVLCVCDDTDAAEKILDSYGF
ncbi:MAG: DUF4358 domain-containing protein [Clostridiales bacterium]|nr:DUF4358 domain-containing protein [Clostridiales bacterium]MCC8106479.1 DUF4358 domain-containing protein [Clostridiales bacterium]